MFSGIALLLEGAGADCIAICSNTPHMAANAIRQKIKIPLVHIAEETAKEIAKQNIKTVGLLGTKPTMEGAFFKDKLQQAGIETVIPDNADRDYIHAAILNELTQGIFKNETKNKFLSIIDKLKMQNAGGVILGCTEIPMLINTADCSVPAFDTTLIHSRALVNFALAAEPAPLS
jgi:aspartate racemase